MDDSRATTAVQTRALRARLALACNILAMEGHTDISLGHASLREPGANEYWVKASGFGLEEVATDDIILVDLEGTKRAGGRVPSPPPPPERRARRRDRKSTRLNSSHSSPSRMPSSA